MALLSRVADSLFWLGRSLERAESTARLLDVTFHGRLEPMDGAQVAGATNTWSALITTLGLDRAFTATGLAAEEQEVVSFLTVSTENSSSIVSSLAAARENARSVRDFLSSETWVAINRLYHSVAARNIHLILADGLYDFCDEVRHGTQLVHGTAEATSLHDEGWYWLRSGLYLERADMVTRILDSKYHLLLDSLDEVGGSLDRFQWMALLRSLSGYEAFRRTHEPGFEPARIVEFLLLNRAFPRSLYASIHSLHEALSLATEGADRRQRNPVLKATAALENRLAFESAEQILEAGLHEFLREAQDVLAHLSSIVSQSFFLTSHHAA